MKDLEIQEDSGEDIDHQEGEADEINGDIQNSNTAFHLVHLNNVNAMDVVLKKSKEIEFHITGGIVDF